MKLEVGKSYSTRNGQKVRVICADCDYPHYPVVALFRELPCGFEKTRTYTKDGHNYTNAEEHELNIIGPWTDLKEGQLVFVGDPKHMTLVRRFVSMSDDGSHNVLADFDKPEVWNNCRAITPEDLI